MYTAAKLIKGELVIEYNPINKPEEPLLQNKYQDRDEMIFVGDEYRATLKKWEESHKIVHLCSREDHECVLRYVDYMVNGNEKHNDSSTRRDNALKEGVPLDCIHVDDISNDIPDKSYVAYFKSKPKYYYDSYRYPLYKHLSEQHDLILTESELDEIIHIVRNLKENDN